MTKTGHYHKLVSNDGRSVDAEVVAFSSERAKSKTWLGILFTGEWIWQEFRETLRPCGDDVCVCHPPRQQEATLLCS